MSIKEDSSIRLPVDLGVSRAPTPKTLRVGVVGSLRMTRAEDLEPLGGLAHEVDWLRVTADAAGDPPPAWIRERFRGRLIFASPDRGVDSGGTTRRDRLRGAAEEYDL